MFLSWERQGKFYKAKVDPEVSPFNALVTQVPRGFQIGIYLNRSVVASEFANTLKEAKAWSESFINQLSGELNSVGRLTEPSSVVPSSSIPAGLKVDSVVDTTSVVSNK